MSIERTLQKGGHREHGSTVVELWSSTVLGRGYMLGPPRSVRSCLLWIGKRTAQIKVTKQYWKSLSKSRSAQFPVLTTDGLGKYLTNQVVAIIPEGDHKVSTVANRLVP